MQVLVMQLHGQDYAIATRDVRRVLPAMSLTALAHAPAFIAGVMNYHGAPVPVVDLARVNAAPVAATDIGTTLPDDAAPAFDTRIILVEHRAVTGQVRQLGLRATHVVGIRSIDPAALVPSGVHDPATPFLGQVVADQQPMLQLIELAQLLPAHVCDWLFDAVDARAC